MADINWGGGGDYSSGEKVVGKWIDGKPVYQQTVYIATGSSPVSGTMYRGTYQFSFDIKEIIYCQGITFWTGGSSPIPFMDASSKGGVLWCTNSTGASSTATKNTIYLQSYGSAYLNNYVTVKYTKVSDYS